MYSPQHKTSSYEDIEASKTEESKTNTDNEIKVSFFQTRFNWQRNRISSTPTSRFSYSQPSSFLTHSHQFLNTTKYYKLITTEPTLWERLSQSMNSIINTPTILPFQYMLNHIQNQLSSRNRDMPDISVLDDVLRSLPNEIQQHLQTRVFPEVAQFILRTPALFPNPESFLILTQGKTDTVSLTREQCACLLAHMFMCTTLRQNSSNLPMRYDFSQLYSRTQQDDKDAVKVQKIFCLLNYFYKITTSSFEPKGIVTFSRVHLDEKTHGLCDLRAWTQVFDILKEVEIDPRRKIEDTQNTVEIDFANKYLGGGVLGAGAVQEEIQFITRPEQLVGILFCEAMTDKEAIVVRGAKVYSRYKGYANTFTFDKEPSFCDNKFDCEREVVAIDAKDFSNFPYYSQFSEHEILRELNKAYVGFVGDDEIPRTETGKKAISTGNWGCGCFKGDVQLKFLVQWMAATRAGRHMSYHPFGKADISGFERIVKVYKGKSVGRLMNDILKCSSLMSTGKKSLFERLITMVEQSNYGHL